jgi:putative endonuclease
MESLSWDFFMSYFTYILQSDKDGSYYIGQTNDVFYRLNKHNQGKCRYTKTKTPWKLVWVRQYSSRSESVRQERMLKGYKSSRWLAEFIKVNRKAEGE